MKLVPVELVGGQVIAAHTQDKCFGQACCIHNVSDHHMKDWPQNWREDASKMERLCEHGIGHPDPDDINPNVIHGCDGCCAPPREALWKCPACGHRITDLEAGSMKTTELPCHGCGKRMVSEYVPGGSIA